MKNLREENTLRNHLVHSEYTWHRDLKQGEEIKMARSQNSSGARNYGHFQIKSLNRNDFLEFVEYQYKILRYLEGRWIDLELFLYDEAYISTNSSEFDLDILQFVQSDEVSPGSGFFSEEYDDYWSPAHSEIQDFLSRRADELLEIEEFRRKLKIKSANYDYSRVPPVEGDTLSITDDTVISIHRWVHYE